MKGGGRGPGCNIQKKRKEGRQTKVNASVCGGKQGEDNAPEIRKQTVFENE